MQFRNTQPNNRSTTINMTVLRSMHDFDTKTRRCCVFLKLTFIKSCVSDSVILSPHQTQNNAKLCYFNHQQPQNILQTLHHKDHTHDLCQIELFGCLCVVCLCWGADCGSEVAGWRCQVYGAPSLHQPRSPSQMMFFLCNVKNRAIAISAGESESSAPLCSGFSWFFRIKICLHRCIRIYYFERIWSIIDWKTIIHVTRLYD